MAGIKLFFNGQKLKSFGEKIMAGKLILLNAKNCSNSNTETTFYMYIIQDSMNNFIIINYIMTIIVHLMRIIIIKIEYFTEHNGNNWWLKFVKLEIFVCRSFLQSDKNDNGLVSWFLEKTFASFLSTNWLANEFRYSCANIKACRGIFAPQSLLLASCTWTEKEDELAKEILKFYNPLFWLPLFFIRGKINTIKCLSNLWA